LHRHWPVCQLSVGIVSNADDWPTAHSNDAFEVNVGISGAFIPANSDQMSAKESEDCRFVFHERGPTFHHGTSTLTCDVRSLDESGSSKDASVISTFDIALLLPCLGFESERRCVFGDGAFCLVGGTVGEFGVDFEGDVDRRVGVAGEERDDLFGDLDETHFGS